MWLAPELYVAAFVVVCSCSVEYVVPIRSSFAQFDRTRGCHVAEGLVYVQFLMPLAAPARLTILISVILLFVLLTAVFTPGVSEPGELSNASSPKSSADISRIPRYVFFERPFSRCATTLRLIRDCFAVEAFRVPRSPLGLPMTTCSASSRIRISLRDR